MVRITRSATLLAGTVALGGVAISAKPPDPATPVTFQKDVLPILQTNCQSCHRPGQIGPMPLTTYKEARPWAKAIMKAVSARRMPPWPADSSHSIPFLNDRSLKQADIDTIVAWAGAGAPEGDAKDAPASAEFPVN